MSSHRSITSPSRAHFTRPRLPCNLLRRDCPPIDESCLTLRDQRETVNVLLQKFTNAVYAGLRWRLLDHGRRDPDQLLIALKLVPASPDLPVDT